MKIQRSETQDRVFPAVFTVTVEAKLYHLNPLECGGRNA